MIQDPSSKKVEMAQLVFLTTGQGKNEVFL
jgi:hypothetical protein